MPSTYSSKLRLELPATGEQAGTWGNTVNTNLGTLLENAIAGTATHSTAGAGDTTLTALNGTDDESRCAVVKLTGVLTGSHNVICPTASKLYLVQNATSGAFTVTFKTAAGTGVLVPQGTFKYLYCDGTNVVEPVTPLLAGGALGTPSSGTVTNLTGTASININGTVGGVTPAAGSFTTLAQTGTATTNTNGITLGGTTTGYNQIYMTNTGGVTVLGVDNAAGTNTAAAYTTYLNSLNPIHLQLGGVSKAVVSSTGLAVTGTITSTVPAAGAFTTLSASGLAYLSGGMWANGAGADAANSGGAYTRYGANGFQMWQSNTAETELHGHIYAGSWYTPIKISSTGLAVTGTISATTGAAVGGATAGTGGIAFPATAVAVADANTLDDYEEGTWTPTIAGSTTAGAQTYSLQNGYYTKIGNKVFIEYYIAMTTKDAATAGYILLVGLPFTSATGVGGVGRGDSWMGHNNLTLSANYYDAYLAMSSANTIAYFSQAGSGQTFSNIPVSGLAGTSAFRGSFSYTV